MVQKESALPKIPLDLRSSFRCSRSKTGVLQTSWDLYSLILRSGHKALHTTSPYKLNTKKDTLRYPSLVVDATGFEPATSASRTQRSTKLSHASFRLAYYSTFFPKKQVLFTFAPVLRQAFVSVISIPNTKFYSPQYKNQYII